VRRLVLLVTIGILGFACAPSWVGDSQSSAPSGTAQDNRAVRMAIRYEPADLAPKISSQSGGFAWKVPFNAYLALIDAKGDPQPYLAETLPQLNTPTWQVFPDGRMETTHRLRPNLTWQDGQPLTAEDFVFAWKVYTNPNLGVFSPIPQDKMDEVLAPDARTLVIRWGSLYPDASSLTEARDGSLEALPRHILAEPFAEVVRDPAAKDRFLNLPYWTAEYVGAGPYRLESWEPGYQLTGVAFDGHVLGRSKIGRLIMRIYADENVVLSTIVAGGTIDISTRFTLRFEHALVLKRQWEAAGHGTLDMGGGTAPVSIVFQFRPEFLKSPELLDVRVRRALAHAMDKEAIVEGLYEGVGDVPDTWVLRSEPYFSEVDRAITKYPYDPRRSDQLLQEAGLTRDREGFFAGRSGERFAPPYLTTANLLTTKANTIAVEAWRRAGIDAQLSTLPAALDRDLQARHTFPGIATIGTSSPDMFPSIEIGTPDKRWAGQNRGGWSHPEYDRLWAAYNSGLDRSERVRIMVGLARLVSDEVPGIMVYNGYYPTFAFVSSLKGPEVGSAGTQNFWNIHEWEFR